MAANYVIPGYNRTAASVAAGAVASGGLATGAVNSGSIASGVIGAVHIQDGTIITADIASGQVQSGQLASGAITGQAGGGAFNLASGSIGSFDIGSGAIVSGRVASGQLGNFHIASGQIQGAAGAGVLNIASGTIGGVDFSSGATVRTAFQAGGAPVVSGGAVIRPVLDQVTDETVSGHAAVYITQSGYIGVAKAAVSGRTPAVGVAIGNALSGLTVSWLQVGALQFASGMADFSGFLGARVWLGRSGQVVAVSGSWGSGGWASGDIGQPLGIVANSGGVHFNIGLMVLSGGPLGGADLPF